MSLPLPSPAPQPPPNNHLTDGPHAPPTPSPPSPGLHGLPEPFPRSPAHLHDNSNAIRGLLPPPPRNRNLNASRPYVDTTHDSDSLQVNATSDSDRPSHIGTLHSSESDIGVHVVGTSPKTPWVSPPVTSDSEWTSDIESFHRSESDIGVHILGNSLKPHPATSDSEWTSDTRSFHRSDFGKQRPHGERQEARQQQYNSTESLWIRPAHRARDDTPSKKAGPLPRQKTGPRMNPISFEKPLPRASQFRRHDYHAPESRYGRKIWMDVELRAIELGDQVDTEGLASWSWPDTSGKYGTDAQALTYTTYSAAKRWYNIDNNHRLDLTSSEDLERNHHRTSKWLHVCRQKPSFDEFQAIAVNTPGLSDDWKVVVLSLLQRVREVNSTRDEREWRLWVQRADSSTIGAKDHLDANLTATSLSFPYFAVRQDCHPGSDPYGYQRSKHGNFEYLFPAMAKDQNLYVPHIWAIMMNDTLITYGPASFDDISGSSLSVLEKVSNSSSGPSVVKVVDVYGCNHMLAIQECKTYFELSETLDRRIWGPLMLNSTDFEVGFENGSPVTANRWVFAVNTEKSDIVTIIMFRKPLSLPSSMSVHHDRRSKGHIERRSQRTRLKSHEDLSNDQGDLILPGKSHRHSQKRTEAPSALGQAMIAPGKLTNPESSKDTRTTMSLAVRPYRNSVSAKIKHNDDHDRVVFPSARCDVSKTHELEDIQKLLRSTRGAHPITRDFPVSLDASLTNVDFDTDHQEQKRLELEERGLVLFDPTVRKEPSLYILPQVQPNAPGKEKALDILTKYSIRSETSRNSRRKFSTTTETDQTQTDCKEDYDEKAASQLATNIPRFLSWASSPTQTVMRSNGSETHETRSYSVRVLDSMHELLMRQDGPERKSRAHSYRWARTTSRITLLHSRPSLNSRSNENNLTSAEPTAPNTTQTTQSPKSGPEEEKNATPDFVDPIHCRLREENEKMICDMFGVVSAILDHFLPLSTNHEIVEKCWGAFEVMFGSIHEATRYVADVKDAKSSFWTVRDISDHLASLEVPQPSLEWKNCYQCQSASVYRTKEEAKDHLHKIHYCTPGTHATQSDTLDEQMEPWLRSFEQYRLDQRFDLFLHYLKTTQEYLRRILTRAKTIREGVANTRHSKFRQYRLPTSLVKSLEHTIMLLVYTPRAFTFVDRYCRHFPKNLQDRAKISKISLPMKAIQNELDKAGSAAILELQKAEQDILLMARTNYHRGIVEYNDVGPEYILATIMGNLAVHPILDGTAVDGVYSMFYDRMYSNALSHPRAKVIRDIFLMHEEVRNVRAVIYDQRYVFDDFMSVLQPWSFKATTTTRCNRYNAESQFLKAQIRNRWKVIDELASLEDSLDDLNQRVYQVLQVNQENHGNAILVFTIVTIIFLPLSWATSYLGMNTSDIRNLRQGQWLFWSVGGPLTAVVIGVALLAVLKGEAIREFMIRKDGELRSRFRIKEELGRQSTRVASNMLSTRRTETVEEKTWIKKRKRRAYPEDKGANMIVR